MSKKSSNTISSNVHKENNSVQTSIFELIEAMSSVSVDDSEAKKNKYSISDNKGGRILL